MSNDTLPQYNDTRLRGALMGGEPPTKATDGFNRLTNQSLIDCNQDKKATASSKPYPNCFMTFLTSLGSTDAFTEGVGSAMSTNEVGCGEAFGFDAFGCRCASRQRERTSAKAVLTSSMNSSKRLGPMRISF